MIWNYSNEQGPEYWAELCEEFSKEAAYAYQSPVSLAKEVISERIEHADLDFHYGTIPFKEEHYNHSVHLTPQTKKCRVSFKGETYTLTDIHFHLPSEHSIEGSQYPLETHLVHMSVTGALLVVGTVAHVETSITESSVVDFTEFDPLCFLPEARQFYSYTGSLTTPPTKGPVQWVVFEEAAELPQGLTNILKNRSQIKNNRPLQPLNGRKIQYTGDC